MLVIVNQPTKKGIKTISGKLIQDGATVITAVVYDSKGSSSIKRFQKSKVSSYRIVEEAI